MLDIKIGQASVAGLKPVNQDSVGARVPDEPTLTSKGVAVAISDGISSSQVSQVASEIAVLSFLSDYYSTSDAWTVKSSGLKVLKAINYWLYSQTKNSEHRFDFNKGYVCTFSALVIKSHTAHLFHTGDSRVYRLTGDTLEQLTVDHRRRINDETSYLSRALGIDPEIEIDYRSFAVKEGETFLLATDGLFNFVAEKEIAKQASQLTLDTKERCDILIQKALDKGSDDNLSIQIVDVIALPEPQLTELTYTALNLSPAPILTPGDSIDGYQILRELSISSRSHVFLAQDTQTETFVVLKTPSAESSQDIAHLDTFLLEDWIAKKLSNPHLMQSHKSNRVQSSLYTVTEYIDGLTLSQWIKDNLEPDINTVRQIITQIAKGLQAMHRQEMIHQDIRPHNIMIDKFGVVKIIDFGATNVAGITEIYSHPQSIMGTAQYTAPEYFIGHAGSHRSDIFSLGVIAYQMLTGKFPYGVMVSKSTTVKSQQKLQYVSASSINTHLPDWIDFALKKATSVEPHRRYEEVSEFVFDLTNPNPKADKNRWKPIAERNPILFWQRISLILFVALLLALAF
ncbi:protein kinase domain-containing protein [Vibrio sp. WJH972]